MIAIIVSGAISFLFVILSTSIGVNYFKSRNIGQPIQEEVVFHDHKKGTPTMGGVFIILGTLRALFPLLVVLFTVYFLFIRSKKNLS